MDFFVELMDLTHCCLLHQGIGNAVPSVALSAAIRALAPDFCGWCSHNVFFYICLQESWYPLLIPKVCIIADIQCKQKH